MKYTSVYTRSRSPFYYCAYVDPVSFKWVWRSTGIRIDDPRGKFKAFEFAKEKSKAAIAAGRPGAPEHWDTWVPGFIESYFKGTTRLRVRSVWRHWREFFEAERITTPRALDYPAVMRFIDQRSRAVKPNGQFVKRNSVLGEVTYFSSIMKEACRRSFATSNPCSLVSRKLDPPDHEKPEITPAEEARIRELLKKKPEWMRTCFEIAIHQGCRLRETQVPWSRVDLDRKTITFIGKGNRKFTTKLHPELVPILKPVKDRGDKFTCELPTHCQRDWWKFFKTNELGHLCFHCTRVTVITRLARAGVSPTVAMRFVNHASSSVHQIYQRLNLGDLDSAIIALSCVPGTESRVPPKPVEESAKGEVLVGEKG